MDEHMMETYLDSWQTQTKNSPEFSNETSNCYKAYTFSVSRVLHDIIERMQDIDPLLKSG